MSEKQDSANRLIQKMRANTNAKKLRTAAKPGKRPRVIVRKARHTEEPGK